METRAVRERIRDTKRGRRAVTQTPNGRLCLMEKIYVKPLRRTTSGPCGPPWEDLFFGLAEVPVSLKFLCFPHKEIEILG